MKLTTLLLLLISTGAIAGRLSNSAISEGRGEAKTCTVAENLAIKDALEKVSGKEFNVEKKQYCIETKDQAYCNYIRDIDFTTSGTVAAILDKEVNEYGKQCMVDIKVEVEPSRQFNVVVRGKNFYSSGDVLDFSVKANEPLYVHVFNVHKKGVELLFPNDYNKSNLIDDEFNLTKDSKVQYKTFLNNGDKSDEETILFLFTKHKIDISNKIDKDKLKELINSIPSFSKRVITQQVLIKRSVK